MKRGGGEKREGVGKRGKGRGKKKKNLASIPTGKWHSLMNISENGPKMTLK